MDPARNSDYDADSEPEQTTEEEEEEDVDERTGQPKPKTFVKVKSLPNGTSSSYPKFEAVFENNCRVYHKTKTISNSTCRKRERKPLEKENSLNDKVNLFSKSSSRIDDKFIKTPTKRARLITFRISRKISLSLNERFDKEGNGSGVMPNEGISSSGNHSRGQPQLLHSSTSSNICWKGFGHLHLTSLSSHLEIEKTGRNIFICWFCDFRTPSFCDLYEHIKGVHKGASPSNK